MEDNSEISNEKTSLFHSGFAQIDRLNELWMKANRFALSKTYLAWNNVLDILWRELAGDLKEDDEDSKEYFDKISGWSGEIMILKGRLLNKNIRLNDYNLEMEELLNEKDIFLRRLQNKLGKGTKLVNVDDDYIE